MKLGVLTVPFEALSLEETVKYLAGLGVQAVELGTGCFTNDCHCNVEELLADPGKAVEIKSMLAGYGMTISALSCHGNPVHPDKQIAEYANKIYEDTLKAAQMLDVDTVVTFSGCPGSDPAAKRPNWVTCAWPPEYGEILEYQWEKCLIPYWKKAAKSAEAAGVKVAIEMHPGFSVYNAETLLRLREAAGKAVGANFDPSHLFWQGTGAVAAIYELGDAVHYVHAKDCRIDESNVKKFGVLDTKHYSQVKERAWVFRTVGYGHDEKVWRDIVSALRTIGYDGTISIEHEDSLMSIKEGIEKAILFLKNIVIQESAAEMWWA